MDPNLKISRSTPAFTSTFKKVCSQWTGQKGDCCCFFAHFDLLLRYENEFEISRRVGCRVADCRPGAQDLDQAPLCTRRGDLGLPRLVPAPLYRKSGCCVRHASDGRRRLRLGQAHPRPVPYCGLVRYCLPDLLPESPQGDPEGCVGRLGADAGRCCG